MNIRPLLAWRSSPAPGRRQPSEERVCDNCPSAGSDARLFRVLCFSGGEANSAGVLLSVWSLRIILTHGASVLHFPLNFPSNVRFFKWNNKKLTNSKNHKNTGINNNTNDGQRKGRRRRSRNVPGMPTNYVQLSILRPNPCNKPPA